MSGCDVKVVDIFCIKCDILTIRMYPIMQDPRVLVKLLGWGGAGCWFYHSFMLSYFRELTPFGISTWCTSSSISLLVPLTSKPTLFHFITNMNTYALIPYAYVWVQYLHPKCIKGAHMQRLSHAFSNLGPKCKYFENNLSLCWVSVALYVFFWR